MKLIDRMRARGIKLLPVTIALFLILGPLWGYIGMFICKLMEGGDFLDALTFYLMVIGWMMAPIGVLLLLYCIMAGAILSDRRDSANRQLRDQ